MFQIGFTFIVKEINHGPCPVCLGKRKIAVFRENSPGEFVPLKREVECEECGGYGRIDLPAVAVCYQVIGRCGWEGERPEETWEESYWCEDIGLMEKGIENRYRKFLLNEIVDLDK